MKTLNVQFVFLETVPEIGVSVIDLLLQANFADTKSEARRHIKSGAFRINDQKVIDEKARLVQADGRYFLLQKK